jgi:glycosyltransferase involved in cell wall biosynthesis
MRIGVAIPCFIKHISHCYELLDSINAQTRLPDQVVVSCSSSRPEDFVQKEYKFPLLVIITEERKNAGQNRNIAADKLDTDVISFIDADDIMHPQRLEAIEQAFNDSLDIVMHAYFLNEECDQEFPTIQNVIVEKDNLCRCTSGCIRFKKFVPNSRIHHSQVSVTRKAFEAVRFREDRESESREDCRFCFGVFSLPDIQSGYLRYPLSKYKPNGTMG